MNETLAQSLAIRIASTRFEDLSEAARRCASIGLADTIAVTLAGAEEEATRIIRAVVAEDGRPVPVLGCHSGVPLLSAALVNGTAANVVDFDDSTNHLGGHPSSPVLSALLPLAARRMASGRDLIVAYAVGVEAETQIARAVNFHHYEKGWHPTATLGVFGAAAACARLMGLDTTRTAVALGICASLASGIKANFGTMTKPLHIGHAARSGLMSALLAEQGFTSGADALEHHHGFLNVFNGAGHHDERRALAKWGSPFDIEYPGLTIKQYPCCLSVQSAVDAALALSRRQALDPERVKSIDVRIVARRLAHTNLPHPKSALESKLSIQYCVARALLNGELLVEHFRGDRYLDPDCHRLMAKVHADTLPAEASVGSEALGASVLVETTSGERFEASVERPVGHDAGVPLPEPLLRRKFDGCVVGHLSNSRASRLYEACWGIARLPSVADLLSLTDADAG